MAHFLDHHPRDRPPVPVRWRGFEKMPLLFNAGEFGVSLIHNHVHQSIAHLLSWNLPQVLPLAPAFVMAKLDLFGFDGAEKRLELKLLNLISIDADLLPPFVKETDPVTECSDFCNFARHN